MQEKEAEDFLYVKLAADFQQQIQNSLLKPGDKLPSLRSLSLEHGISIGTAYKTYIELENMGLIQARSKSGYYVKFRTTRFAETPVSGHPPKKVEPANVGEMDGV